MYAISQQTFSPKGKIINILDFVRHSISDLTTNSALLTWSLS